MIHLLPIIESIQSIVPTTGGAAFIVGGVVRDLLLGKPQQDDDLDITIEGNVFEVAEQFSARVGGSLHCYPEFLSAKVRMEGNALREVDFVATRQEVYPRPGALPTVSPGSLDDDLRRRDFSVNAMALPLQQLLPLLHRSAAVTDVLPQVVDPLNGWHDLQSRRIRVLHERSFLDDPTRLFRAARYAARLGGTLERYTEELLQQALNGDALTTISLTRRVNELCRVAEEPPGTDVISKLKDWGVLRASGLVRPDRSDTFSNLARNICESPEGREIRVQLMYLLLARSSSYQSAEQFFKELGLAKARRKEFLEAIAAQSRSSLAEAYRRLIA